ncbi:glutathione S-transferase C-terminal domain-containing protein [Variovorax paradoxus]|nr:glutathione S-transferase C-terminal domain-containing protein [Variovorax paradoxus]
MGTPYQPVLELARMLLHLVPQTPLRGMHYFDAVLKKQPFVAGDAFSMADITVIGGLIFAELVELSVPAECEPLRAWYARMQERTSVQHRVTMSEPIEVST